MPISVVTNIPMLRGLHSLDRAHGIIGQAAERLSTGKRINRAADDPAGLIAADNLAAERSSLGGKITSSERKLHLLGAKEGALSVIEDLFHELDGLVHQAANGDAFSVEEREAFQLQAEGIYNTIEHLVNTASFNGEKILSGRSIVTIGSTTSVSSGLKIGNLGGVSRETENELGETVTENYSLKDIFNDLNLVDGDVEKAAESVGSARKAITRMRAGVGVQINGIETDINVMSNRMVTLAETESEIRDADYAKETAELIRGQLLEIAAIEMLKVAAEIPKAALRLMPGYTEAPRLFR